MNYKTKKHKGFTLVEAMVAISILSLAVTGPLIIAQKGLGSAIYARDQITAFYLAQEAVEYIRNVRDSNRISGVEWLLQFSVCKENDSVSGSEKCQIDSQYSDFTNENAILACPSEACPVLSLNTVNNIYGYPRIPLNNWISTIFTRTITIDDRTKPNQEVMISVSISWKTKLFEPLRVFTIKEYIFNF